MPDRFFETWILKEAAAQAKWSALSPAERRAISFRFFQIVAGPELRSRIKRLPDQVRANGKRLQRFLIDMDFGEFAFAIGESRSRMVLIDFYVDAALLRVELRCPAWHH